MDVSESLGSLAKSIALQFKGRLTRDRALEILGGFAKAYPKLTMTDQTGNCLTIGQPVQYQRSMQPDGHGHLLFVLVETLEDRFGQEVILSRQGVILLEDDRFMRVNWDRLSAVTSRNDRGPSHGEPLP